MGCGSQVSRIKCRHHVLGFFGSFVIEKRIIALPSQPRDLSIKDTAITKPPSFWWISFTSGSTHLQCWVYKNSMCGSSQQVDVGDVALQAANRSTRASSAVKSSTALPAGSHYLNDIRRKELSALPSRLGHGTLLVPSTQPANKRA
eukprot:1156894-Pelagomonas_calceolata.AAC.7